MFDDGERTLNLVGALIALGLLVGLGTMVLAGVNAPTLATDPPDADWRLERLNATHVQVVHAGGEPVHAADLAVTVGRYERHPGWSGVLAEGDGGTFRAAPGEAVALTWNGGRGDVTRIARWPAGGAGTSVTTSGG